MVEFFCFAFSEICSKSFYMLLLEFQFIQVTISWQTFTYLLCNCRSLSLISDQPRHEAEEMVPKHYACLFKHPLLVWGTRSRNIDLVASKTKAIFVRRIFLFITKSIMVNRSFGRYLIK